MTTKTTPRVAMTDKQIETACKRLYRLGYTTKTSMLVALRGEGQSVRQQRLYPIAETVIAQATAKPPARGVKAS